MLIGWNLFAFDDLGRGMAFMRALFGLTGGGTANGETLYLLYNHAALLILCAVGSTRLPKRAGQWLCGRLESKTDLLAFTRNVFYIVVFLLSVAWLVDASYNPFLYFRF